METVKVRVGKKSKQHGTMQKLILLPIFLLAGIGCICAVLFLQISNVVVVGNEMYSDEEIADMVFEDEMDTRYISILLGLSQNKTIPFIQKYSVELIGLQGAKVTVYEKNVIGCFAYMSNYMYFDQDGIVLESSSKRMEGVPLIAGFSFDKIVLAQKLPVEDETIFTDILNMAQLIATNHLDIKQIYYDSNMDVTLYLEKPDTVRVYIGQTENIQHKLSLLKDMLPELEGLSGTLYLDHYTGIDDNSSYTFKQDNTTGK